MLVQGAIFPRTDLRKDQILVVEKQLSGKMDLRELTGRSTVACGSITTPSSWPEVEGLVSEKLKD